MININNRLKSIANFILNTDSKSIIDVGCDHALLDIYLIQNDNNLSIIASDINKYPLEKAKENIERYSLLNKIKLSLRDGIDNLESDIDTIVISGMGTETIIDILTKNKNNLKNVDKIILSSNNKYSMLRKEVIKLGYYINREKIVYEDEKYYIIIEFLKGNSKYSDNELFFGPYLLKNKDDIFYDYFNNLKNIDLDILNKLPENSNRKKKINDEIKMLESEIF